MSVDSLGRVIVGSGHFTQAAAQALQAGSRVADITQRLPQIYEGATRAVSHVPVGFRGARAFEQVASQVGSHAIVGSRTDSLERAAVQGINHRPSRHFHAGFLETTKSVQGGELLNRFEGSVWAATPGHNFQRIDLRNINQRPNHYFPSNPSLSEKIVHAGEVLTGLPDGLPNGARYFDLSKRVDQLHESRRLQLSESAFSKFSSPETAEASLKEWTRINNLKARTKQFIVSDVESSAWEERGRSYDRANWDNLKDATKELALSVGCELSGDYAGALEHAANATIDIGKDIMEDWINKFDHLKKEIQKTGETLEHIYERYHPGAYSEENRCGLFILPDRDK